MSILEGSFNNVKLGSSIEERNKIINIGELKISELNVCEKCNYPWNPKSEDYQECKNCGNKTLTCPRCKHIKNILPEKSFKVIRKTFFGENTYTEVLCNYISENMSKMLKERYESSYIEAYKKGNCPKQKIYIEESN
jgi:DNA-directed RNA polymerase subunit RPC12/RpoP